MDGNNKVAQDIIREQRKIQTDRTNFNTLCQEVAERALPSQYKLFNNPGSIQYQKGEDRTEYLFDSTAAISLGRFTSILDSFLTPRNQTWHRLQVTNAELRKNREVKIYFEEVNRRIFQYRYSPKANFSSQNNSIWESLGAFGNGALYTDKMDKGEKGIRYKCCHISGVFFMQNHQGIVDVVYRKFPLTARAAMKMSFADQLPAIIKTSAEKDPEREFEFIHKVCPNHDLDPHRLDYRGMKWSSYYVSIEGQILLEQKGYTSFPYHITRYMQTAGETTGRGPLMEVIPGLKTLNEMKKTILKQGQKTVDPVYLAHDDGVIDSLHQAPGSTIWGGVSAEGKALVHTLPVGNLAAGKELMDDERADIRNAMLISLFQIMTEGPQKTATEVIEIAKEKGILLGPALGRQWEYLGSVVEREADLLSSQGLLPPMPQILIEAQGEYKIEYDSPLSRAQRAEEASGLMHSIQTTLEVVNATQDPTPMDHYNWDVIIPEISDIHGVPTRWMNSADAIQSMRKQRSIKHAAQEQIQAAPGQAALIKAGVQATGKVGKP